MKKLIGLFSFVLFLGVSMTAQENVNPVTTNTAVKKKCDMSSKKCSAACKAAAAKVASMDESIETSTCPVSGTTYYKRKSVNEATGEVTYTDLSYDMKAAKFVNAAAATEVAADVQARGKEKVKSCSKGKGGKKCCAKGAKAKNASAKSCSKGKGGKKCCAKGAKAKSCAKGAKATACAKDCKKACCAKGAESAAPASSGSN